MRRIIFAAAAAALGLEAQALAELAQLRQWQPGAEAPPGLLPRILLTIEIAVEVADRLEVA